MTTRRLQLALVLLVAALAPAETLDRVVVVVNKGIILASQWDEAIRFEALSSGRAVNTLTDSECDAALDRLVDQELILQEIALTTYRAVSAAEVDAKVANLRHQLAPAADDQQWRSLLTSYGLTEDDVRSHIAGYLDILRFVDLRFRPSIHIDARNVEAYYRDTLVPELQSKGLKPPPLQQISVQIEELLVQQRIDELLTAYLKNLRAQSRIQRLEEKAPKPEAGAR
jgi:parvulin-like peptidyl-prolyl isomerase